MFTFKAMNRKVFYIVSLLIKKKKQDNREYTRTTFTGKNVFGEPFSILSFQDYKM